jgi:uncharacterized phiE125 gp8 family phage protein
MKYSNARPSTPALITWDQIAAQLRLDQTDDEDYVNDLIDACTDYAETALESSLLNRTITATFYRQDTLWLPRGPIVSITSVTDANGNHPPYDLEGYGTADLLVCPQGHVSPLTVVYVAGFGTDSTNVPAQIRQAIRVHVSTLYENRESVADKNMMPVPHSLESFYRLNARRRGIA